MFDNAPSNIPVEPEGAGPMPKPPLGSPPPRPQPPAPRPSGAMKGGITAPKSSEPEDMLAPVESTQGQQTEELPSHMQDAPSSGKKFKVLIIVLAAIVGVLILVVAGIFFYRQFVAVPESESDTVMEGVGLETERTAPTSPTVPGGSVTPPSSEGETSPPVVPETPPPNIPEPSPVEGASAIDTDDDGIADEDEIANGTDPRTADTDGDGLDDGNEEDVGSDPLIADTDGDGLTDGDEVSVWLSNPVLADTDGDGFMDGEEVRNGYNPNGEGRLPNG